MFQFTGFASTHLCIQCGIPLRVGGGPTYNVTISGVVAGSRSELARVVVVTSNQEPVTFGTQRSREETLTCQVDFYSFRPGGEEMEEVVEARAWEMVDELAQYVRVTDTTLGGVVRQCFLTDVASDAATDPDVLAKGRMHVVSATFTAENRVRS